MTTNQEGVHLAVRDITGTALSYNEDWHALFDAEGITAGTFNERMLGWINATLSASYTNVNEAMQAFAVEQGFANWASMNTFVAGSEAATFLRTYGPYGMVLDFSDASIAIKEASGVLDFTSQGQVSGGALVGPGAKTTYSAPSAKLTEQADGNLGFQAHNLLLQSEDFSSASWVKTTVTASSAFEITEASGTAVHGVHQDLSAVAGGTYALSCEFKLSAIRTRAILVVQNVSGSAGVYMVCDIAGSQVGVSPTAFGVGYQSAGSPTVAATDSGYVRFTLFVTSPDATIRAAVRLDSGSGTGALSQTYAGDLSARMFVRKAHLRRTPSVDTYIATTTAAAYDLPYVYSGGVRQGIAVEPAATNIVLHSLMGTPAALVAWTGNNSTRVNSPVADPMGTQNAMRVTTTGNSGLNVSAPITTVTGTVYTTSMYLRGNPGEQIYFTGDGTAATQVLVTFDGTWQRVSKTFTASSTTSHIGCERFNRSGGAHLPDVVFDCCLAQFETGTVATSPIITYGAAVARAIDLMYVPASLFPYSATAAFLFAKMVRGSSTPNSRVGVSLNLNGTGGPAGDNISAAYWSNTTAAASWYAGERTKTFSPTPVAGDTVKIASCFATSGTLASVSTQGQAVATSASSTWDGGSNRLYVGVMDATGLWAANDCLIKQIAYFPEYDTAKAEAITT